MEIKLKTKKAHPVETHVSIPVSRKMKQEIEEIKKLKINGEPVAFNEQVRDYFENIISEIKRQAC